MLASDSTVRTPRRAQSSLSNPPSNTNQSSTSNSVTTDLFDTNRKRQNKRDDQIRKKIEIDLKKKNNITLNATSSPTKKSRHSHNAIPGSVMTLKPSDPVILKPTNSVYEAAQLMSVTKENCVLVVDNNEELLGIFTAKDLAFRIVGSNLNANQTTIDHIMTPNPMCAKTSTMASDALNLMVSKGFRHLPVINDSNQIVGVLDITKCYNEAMTKLERMYESSKKLYDAMEGVNAEMGGMNNQPNHITKYFQNLKNLINGPTLQSCLDQRTTPVYCDIKSTVYDAAILMKDNRTTAVLVKDIKNNDEVTGIFTSKDIVLRVIAAGIDPRSCSVIRVMTPKPSYSLADASVHTALRQMFEGRYLNLPVVDNTTNEIIGIVDVLRLTYHTLSQIQSLQSMNGNDSSEVGSNTNEEKEGPAWNKFWTSMDSTTETESLHSALSNTQDVTQSELAQFNVSTNDIVKPSDSISFAGVQEQPLTKQALTANNILPTEVDFEEVCYFKFKTEIGRVHRISRKPADGITSLRELITNKLSKQELKQLLNPSPITKKLEDGSIETIQTFEPIDVSNYSISYIDDENDIVSISSDQDLKDCVYLLKSLKLKDKIDLFIHHPDKTVELDDSQISNAGSKNSSGNGTTNTSSLVQELLLPGALFALSASIIVAFTLSRK